MTVCSDGQRKSPSTGVAHATVMTGLELNPCLVTATAPSSVAVEASHAPGCADATCGGMTGQNVVCFAKDWEEDPTSNNHIMRLLARENQVLWINSIATRTPSLRSGRDLGKIWRKLTSFFRGPEHVADGLWVYTPVVLPFPHSRQATLINRWILRVSVGLIRRRLGMGDFQLWVFIPTAARYVGVLGESMLVYYVTDEYSQFKGVDDSGVAEDDRKLCKQADIIFATAKPLAEKRCQCNPETHLSRHGVDHALFSAALSDATRIPDDLAALPRPVLGFYGALRDWIDYDLIEYLARRHKDWSIALIGEPLVDLTRFRDVPNVHLLGRKPHRDLPACCKGISVGLIPHKVNQLTLHMNPIKLREYLCAGLPVVSVRLPEVENYVPHCLIADDYEQFERAVEAAIRNDSPAARRQRSDAMRPETWERVVSEIGSHVMRVKQKARQG